MLDSFIKIPDLNKQTLIEQLYLKYKFLIFHTSFTILQDHMLAEDATHTVFLKLMENPIKIEKVPSDKRKSFIVIITRNVAIDMYRKIKRKRATCLHSDRLELVDNKPLPLEELIGNETIEHMYKLVKTLDRKYADTLLLKFFYELSNTQIAILLGISEITVRVRLHRGKKLLASKFGKVSL